jgi:serine-type D-Ala-D-Ala carboxypeptidase/endopeptidase (penicillin-binding protein 4)
MTRPAVRALTALLAGAVLGVGGIWAVLQGTGPDTEEFVDTAPSASAEDDAALPDDRQEDLREVSRDERQPDPEGASRQAPEPEEPAAPPVPETLVAHVEALLAQEEIRAVEHLSVVVLDEAGQEVASLGPDDLVMPASTAKMVTAASAMRLLGPEYRYVTRAFATGETADGSLEGDLVLVGSGDPGLASPEYIRRVYPARPHTELDRLAEEVGRAGIEVVQGSVLGDPRLFADEPVAVGWQDRYFASLDTTRSSGLTVDAGRRLSERGDMLLAEVAEQPARLAAEVMDDLLSERDIDVRGEPDVGQAPPGAREVAQVRSPPLHRFLVHAMQRSDNHMTDGIFRTMGALSGSPTWEGSETVVKRALEDTGIDWAEAVMADGSGLSRESRLSGRMLAELDLAMTADFGGEWQDLLAVAGESGTLRGRLRGTIAEGRLAGKTGALRDVRALAGQVNAVDGRRYHFAVAGSELDGLGIQSVRRLMDDLAVLLADHPPGCLPTALDDDGNCP